MNTFERMLKAEIDSLIESKLAEIYKQARIGSGDITPDQWERLDRIENDLAKIVLELVRQNATERTFYSIEEDRYYSETELREIYETEKHDELHATFSQFLRACTDKNGFIEEV